MDNNAIKHYEANVKGGQPDQSCTAQASSDPILCTISNLQPSTSYAVDVKACVHGSDGCGPALEKSFMTG